MKFDTSLQTNKYFFSYRNSCTYIMLHHTASEANSINQAKYLAYNPAQVSCHYVVGRGGEIRQIADDTKCTWHAWKWEREGIVDKMNLHAIGIEVCGVNSFSEKQKKAVRELLDYLMEKHNIETKHIIRHKDYAPWRKIDIDDSFWSEYGSREAYQQSFIKGGSVKKLLQEMQAVIDKYK